MDLMHRLNEAKQTIKKQSTHEPRVAIILGSGLGDLAAQIEAAEVFAFADIPHFPTTNVSGHAGRLVLGRLGGASVAVFQGRMHYYEGHSLDAVTFSVRLAYLLGAHTLIVTNAAGAVNTVFAPGDLMLIEDHINLVFDNPLVGNNIDDLGPRFPDASSIYTPRLCALARTAADEHNLTLRHGVYAWWKGPSYETPAEIRMIRTLGADAVGMSTVPETLVASHMGMAVLGISCLTNMASGILDQPLSHDEVITVAAKVKDDFIALIKTVLTHLA